MVWVNMRKINVTWKNQKLLNKSFFLNFSGQRISRCINDIETFLFFYFSIWDTLEGLSFRKIIHIGPTTYCQSQLLICTCLRSYLNLNYVLYKGLRKKRESGRETKKISLCYLYEVWKKYIFCDFWLEGGRNIRDSFYSSRYVPDSNCMAFSDSVLNK